MKENPVHTVRDLDPSCRQIHEQGFNELTVSCFLVEGKEKAALIDSGFGQGNIKETVDGLTSLPVILINTHADLDHSHGNEGFGPAHMHPAEFERYHADVGQNANVAPLWEGDVVDLGGRRLEVIHVPGHTPGSIVLLDAENRILFGGDSVQDDVLFLAKQGRDLSAYIESMRKLQRMRDRFDKVYGAHGTTILGAEILDDLLTAAEKLKNGELENVPIPPKFQIEDNIALFVYGSAKLMY